MNLLVTIVGWGWLIAWCLVVVMIVCAIGARNSRPTNCVHCGSDNTKIHSSGVELETWHCFDCGRRFWQ